jgi:predicted GIY-YIG superfamily endonuclease
MTNSIDSSGGDVTIGKASEPAATCVDLAAREQKHNSGKGAKYTRGRGPIRFVYHEAFATFSEACRREAEVKRWRRARKEQLVASQNLS